MRLFLCFVFDFKRMQGNEEVIICSDGEEITFEEIESNFDGKSMPRFVENPKIFIYDCCRGARRAEPIEMEYNFKGGNLENKRHKLLHKDSNTICIYATTKYYNTPDTEQGSYLTQSIRPGAGQPSAVPSSGFRHSPSAAGCGSKWRSTCPV